MIDSTPLFFISRNHWQPVPLIVLLRFILANWFVRTSAKPAQPIYRARHPPAAETPRKIIPSLAGWTWRRWCYDSGAVGADGTDPDARSATSWTTPPTAGLVDHWQSPRCSSRCSSLPDHQCDSPGSRKAASPAVGLHNQHASFLLSLICRIRWAWAGWICRSCGVLNST